jgi:hypothetical protein
MKKTPLLAAILMCISPIQPARAAYLQSDYGDSEERPAPEPAVKPPVAPVPERARDNAVTRLIRRVEVGDHWHYGNLAIYPLVLRRAGDAADIRTLDEAFDRGWIMIREKDNARVSTLQVRNDSRHHVLLMSGEILTGGKQNRMVRDDVLLRPDSGFVDVSVYCGEKERWSDRHDTFGSAGSVAHPGLRYGAARGESQGDIWNEIDAQSEKAKVSSPTKDYRQIYEDAGVRRQLDDYAAHFRNFVASSTVGAVAVSDGRIIGCDLFSDPALFARLWNKLLRSYSMDVFYRDKGRDYLSARDVRRFLDRALDARYSNRHTDGAGQLLEITGAVEGAALVWDDTVVHTGLFGERVYYTPPPPPPPRPPPHPRPPHPWPPYPVPMWERNAE